VNAWLPTFDASRCVPGPGLTGAANLTHDERLDELEEEEVCGLHHR
jgi:hypothetical protein